MDKKGIKTIKERPESEGRGKSNKWQETWKCCKIISIHSKAISHASGPVVNSSVSVRFVVAAFPVLEKIPLNFPCSVSLVYGQTRMWVERGSITIYRNKHRKSLLKFDLVPFVFLILFRFAIWAPFFASKRPFY